MNKIPMLERFAAQSLVESDGELIFSKEKYAELIIKECVEINKQELAFNAFERLLTRYQEHFGVEE